MSVTKPGSDDHNCGFTNNDPLHQAICRVVAGGITVVAAAANDHHNAAKNIPASYDEVITVSALADTDGKAGGLGGNRCYSWGGYDKDDTFANFSNYGGDVDIIAPGKCIMSTIPGRGMPTCPGPRWRPRRSTGRGGALQGEPAERDAGRGQARRCATWATSTGRRRPTPTRPRAAPRRVEDPHARDVRLRRGHDAATDRRGRHDRHRSRSRSTRSGTFFERVRLSITSLPAGWTGGPSPSSLMGWTANTGRLLVAVPAGTPLGHYQIGVQATNQGRTATRTIDVEVVMDDPTAAPPSASVQLGSRMMLRRGPGGRRLAGRHRPVERHRRLRAAVQPQRRRLEPATALGPTQTHAIVLVGLGNELAVPVAGASTRPGNWSPWARDPWRSRRTPSTTGAPPSAVTAWLERRRTRWPRTRGPRRARPARAPGLTMTFTGHGIAVVAPRSPQRGSAKVYIDGVYTGRSTCGPGRRPVARPSSPVLRRRRQPPITLRVVGSGPHPLFRLDAFVVSK